MRLVIKIAGALLESEEAVQTIARQITELARAGHELLVIHGGGKIFTATLARMTRALGPTTRALGPTTRALRSPTRRREVQSRIALSDYPVRRSTAERRRS
jgi:hypothetical protein